MFEIVVFRDTNYVYDQIVQSWEAFLFLFLFSQLLLCCEICTKVNQEPHIFCIAWSKSKFFECLCWGFVTYVFVGIFCGCVSVLAFWLLLFWKTEKFYHISYKSDEILFNKYVLNFVIFQGEMTHRIFPFGCVTYVLLKTRIRLVVLVVPV